MRHSLTGNEAEHNTVQEPAADVQGGPQVPASSVTSTAQPIRTVCAWCAGEGRETVIVDGPTDAEGRSSHGICEEHKVKATADVLAAIKVYAPLHVIPAQDRIGGYIIRDDKERLIADRIIGINPAAALAHTLNRAVHGFGLCLLHLGERRQDGTCFPCSLKAERHPFAAVGRS